MSAVDNLNNAVAALTEAFATLDTAVKAEVDALRAALAANNTDAVEAAATNIAAITAKISADAAALSASLSPPAPPAS